MLSRQPALIKSNSLKSLNRVAFMVNQGEEISCQGKRPRDSNCLFEEEEALNTSMNLMVQKFWQSELAIKHTIWK